MKNEHKDAALGLAIQMVKELVSELKAVEAKFQAISEKLAEDSNDWPHPLFIASGIDHTQNGAKSRICELIGASNQYPINAIPDMNISEYMAKLGYKLVRTAPLSWAYVPIKNAGE